VNISLADGDSGDDNDFNGTKRDSDGDSFPNPGGGPDDDDNNKLMLKMMTMMTMMMMMITDW